MNMTFKKIMSVVLSIAMISTSITVNNSIAKAATVESMITSGIYNLALGCTAMSDYEQFTGEGNLANLTNGNFDARVYPQSQTNGSYIIDLGKYYTVDSIDQVVSVYNETNAETWPSKSGGYYIQYSVDGLNYTDALHVTGITVEDPEPYIDAQDVSEVDVDIAAVRYVRLFYPDKYSWGVQLTELAVINANGDAQEATVEKCDEAAGVTVEVTDYNTIKYSITAGENQEDYLYMVYMNGTTKIGHGVTAGTEYTVSGVAAGIHTLKVVAISNGKISDGINSEQVIVEDISSLISNSKNVSNKNYNSLASIVEVSTYYDGHTSSTAQVALDGKIETGEGTDKALRTEKNSPQYVVIDLGDYYVADEMERVLLAHTNDNTYPANVKVEFSLDGTTYTKVGNGSGYQYSSTSPINSVMLDSVDAYDQAAVRYVKLTLSDGKSGYGYVINEISVVANTDTPTIKGSDIPEAADIIVNTENLETIKYTIVAGENQENATYIVKLGEEIINSSAVAGTEYIIEGVDAGTHTLKVCTLQDGWQSKGITKSGIVKGYDSYVKDTLNLALRTEHPNVTATCDNDNLAPNYLPGSQDISAGVDALNDGIYENHSHHSGYLQTRPDNDEANFIYDLARDYLPTEIHSVIAMYESANNCATEYEILFSSDGENYEQVFYIKDAKFSKLMNDSVDVSSYTQDTVRYVKYHIITGNYIRHYNDDGSIHYGSTGYHLCELAVMGKESLLPEKVTSLSAESPTYNKVVVNWEDIADPDATYRVYLNGSVIGTNIASGVQTFEFIISAGTYDVAVATYKDEFAGVSKSVSVKVENEPTTPPPTTTQKPTTQKPTTQKPTPAPTDAPTMAPTQAPTVAPTTEAKKPGKAKIKKAKAGKKKVSLKLKNVKGANGYRIKYATNKKFKKAKTKMTKRVNVVIKKLKKGKKYYFKAQAYKLVNGKKLYGTWSKVKASKKVK